MPAVLSHVGELKVPQTLEASRSPPQDQTKNANPPGRRTRKRPSLPTSLVFQVDA
jgi:hypothetical protein